MPRTPYTNRSFTGTTVQARPARQHRLAAAKPLVMPLTDKEKRVRKQQAMFKSADAFGGGSGMGMNTSMAQSSSFFSPQLSTDFLELPQSLREKREISRHFYNTDPIVAQAIDLHTELPLSKVRLAAPKPRTCPKGFNDPEHYGKYILSFFEKMSKRIKLFQRLVTIVHHYWLDGTAVIFAEDGDVDLPDDVGHERQVMRKSFVDDYGEPQETDEEEWVPRDNQKAEEDAYYQKHYQGWDRLIIFPIDQVKITTFDFSDKTRVELIPSDRDRALMEQASQGDPMAIEMAAEIPDEVRQYIQHGKMIPLGSDAEEGSFVYLLCGRKGAGEELGQSILDRCLRTLYYREKLRQAQTQIASRAMTPKRVIWAEDISEGDVEQLREQVDQALTDPDYSIIVNYELHWEEMGSKDRLLDLTSEYEITERHLRTGLGVTESLLSGESLYSGDRLKLEVINQRYLFLREVLQEYVEEYLFKPVARRKGFMELDEWGEETLLFPKLSFTRLPLRDSQDTFDALFNLYQKGSVDIDVILEMFNLDPYDTGNKIKRDLFTVNDAAFQEIIRAAYQGVGGKLAEETDLLAKITSYLGLTKSAGAGEGEGDSRF